MDKNQVVWVGTNNGIDRFDGRWQSLKADQGLPAGAIRAVAQTTDGAIWVGGDHGLVRITGTAADEQSQAHRGRVVEGSDLCAADGG